MSGGTTPARTGETTRDALVAHLNRLLEIELVSDYGPNGLQAEGRPTVRRVVTGVTASLAFLEEAVRRGADAVVVHHGVLWDGASTVLRGSLKKRFKLLLEHDLNLLAYHLPLDRHPEVGNNAPALRDLGVVDLAPFAPHRGRAVGWKGRLPEPEPVERFVARVSAYYQATPTAFLHGPARVSTVGLVSGAAQGDARQAALEGLDAFVTGEVSEYNPHLAREEGLHHLSVGHHASERVGPRRLAEHLRDVLGLDAEFVDAPNPV
ncbi:MAG TPA: Nif3-like dinuclear metal center hexameric protein [Planctomycetota bacterium]|nr:Nif3-like dinuclear metal center hexameric protein [Planctomycetota bacterium]